MAAPGQALAVYLFAILSMSTGVVIFVHFLPTKNEVSFSIVYIWDTVLLTFALLAMVGLIFIRKCKNHIEKVVGHRERMHRTGRGIIIFLCGTGSGILPLFEAYVEISCKNSKTNNTFYVSKLISLLLSGMFFVIELAFIAFTRHCKCKSGFSRVLVSFILSANVCMLTHFVLNVIRASNTNTKQEGLENTTENLTELLIFSSCKNQTEASIAEYIFKYTNTFILEFCLFLFGILIPMWNLAGQKCEENDFTSGQTDDEVSYMRDRNGATNEATANNSNANSYGTFSGTLDTTEGSQADDINLIQDRFTSRSERMKNVLKKTVIFASLHSFYLSLLFALPILGFHIYSDVDDMINDADVVMDFRERNTTLSPFEEGNYYLQTSYNYIVSIMPFIGYLIAMDFDVSGWRVKSDNVLLIASGCGHLLLVLLETADSIASFINASGHAHLTQEIVHFVKVIFYYIGIYFQIMLIMKARAIAENQADDKKTRRLFIKGIIIFLGVCNTERWLADSFLPPTNLRFVNDIQNVDTFGIKNWWFIMGFLFPIVTFYRLLSALLCVEVRDRFQQGSLVHSTTFINHIIKMHLLE